ncbi:hypothetical protein BDR22DRAFT_250772 [Usnea florida]
MQFCSGHLLLLYHLLPSFRANQNSWLREHLYQPSSSTPCFRPSSPPLPHPVHTSPKRKIPLLLSNRANYWRPQSRPKSNVTPANVSPTVLSKRPFPPNEHEMACVLYHFKLQRKPSRPDGPSASYHIRVEPGQLQIPCVTRDRVEKNISA